MNPPMEAYVRLTLEDIFQTACDLPPARRAVYLDEACAGDEKLRRKVEVMLRHHDEDEDFLETPAVEDAFREIAEQINQSGQYRQAMIGRQIGNYRIQALLGKGGMGEVYLAHDDDLDVNVAIKFLTATYAQDPEWQARFNREGLLNHELIHENIAALRHKGQFEGRPFLVFEYIPGQTLDDKLANGPLPLAEALPIFRQLAAGLAHAHSKKIIHRDLKPANIKITPEGQVKILDFGIARRITTDLATVEMKTLAPEEQLTRDFGETIQGEIIGTVVYMSPEQTRGELLDEATDVWSLASVMFQTLTGRLPFKGVDTYDTLNLIRDPRNSPDWRALPANTPKKIFRLLQRSFVKNRQDRSPSAAAIAETIDQLLNPAIKRWKRIAIAATAILSVTTALLLWLWASRVSPPVYLAVMPFKESGEQVTVGEGLAASLRDSLAMIPNLNVLPYTGTGEANLNASSPDVLLTTMEANWLLAGEVQHNGEEVEVKLKIYQPGKSGQPIEETVTGSRRNYWQLQKDLVGRVTSLLRYKPPKQLSAVGFADEEKYLAAASLLQRDLNEETVDQPIRLLEELVQVEPDSARAYAILARAYIRKASLVETDNRDWINKALKSSEEAIRLDAASHEVKVTRGMVLALLQQRAEAIAILKDAWETQPEDATAGLELARTYEEDKQDVDAERVYQSIINRWPGYWLGYNELGAFHFLRGRYNDALVEWSRVLKINPANVAGWENVSAAYFETGQYLQAEQTSRLLLETRKDLSPGEQVRAWSNIAIAQFFQQRFGDAIDSYKQSLAILPDTEDAVLWANFGDAVSQLAGEEKAAYDAYTKAIVIRRNAQLSDKGKARLAETYAKRSQLPITSTVQAAADKNSARAILRQLSGAGQTLDSDALYSIIKADFYLRDLPQAIRDVERAMAAKQNPITLENDPELRQLRQEPDYQRVIEALKRRS
ncbi:MAG: protein kinase [Acidobacteria bacterium]|nr:protein kinase [Acidobacteriota bacterium]